MSNVESYNKDDITRMMLQALTSENMSSDLGEIASEEDLNKAMELFDKVVKVFVDDNTSVQDSFKVITAISDALSFYINVLGETKDN